MNLLPCKGILFDCDGVLVDSDASVYGAWRRWAAEFGLDADTVVDLAHGRRSSDTVSELLPKPQRAGALAAIDRYEIEDASTVRAIPGAVELVDSMPPDAWAVFTSGTYELASARLKAAGLPAPAILVTADDVAHGKPHPEGYRTAAQRLGIDPADTIVLEDAQPGIDAARAAGVRTVVGVGREDLRADAFVPDLTELRWTGTGLAVH